MDCELLYYFNNGYLIFHKGSKSLFERVGNCLLIGVFGRFMDLLIILMDAIISMAFFLKIYNS